MQSSNNLAEPVTKEQIEQFRSQMMAWLDEHLHQII